MLLRSKCYIVSSNQPRSVSLTACCLQVFKVLGREGINVKMMSQGASKNNISLIVSDDEGKNAVRSLHQEFFD